MNSVRGIWFSFFILRKFRVYFDPRFSFLFFLSSFLYICFSLYTLIFYFLFVGFGFFYLFLSSFLYFFYALLLFSFRGIWFLFILVKFLILFLRTYLFVFFIIRKLGVYFDPRFSFLFFL
jgi:hypothetical protein